MKFAPLSEELSKITLLMFSNENADRFNRKGKLTDVLLWSMLAELAQTMIMSTMLSRLVDKTRGG